jgi:hypothetical protein
LGGLWLCCRWLPQWLCLLSWHCWLADRRCRKAVGQVLLLVVLVQQSLRVVCWNGLLWCCYGHRLLCCCCWGGLLLRRASSYSTCCCTLCPLLGSLSSLLLVAALLCLAPLPVHLQEVWLHLRLQHIVAGQVNARR